MLINDMQLEHLDYFQYHNLIGKLICIWVFLLLNLNALLTIAIMLLG